MAKTSTQTKALRDRLPTVRQRELFDALIAQGVRPDEAYRLALWK